LRSIIYTTLALVFCLIAPTAAAKDKSPMAVKTFNGFSEVRSELLNFMGGAKKRIWLSSNYLTDGDLVSALYIAKYRKLDVQVLLGKRKSNFYMSRLNFLKNQKIPVSIEPRSFPTSGQSAVLVDDNLLVINGDLNFLNKNYKYKSYVASHDYRGEYVTAFAKATSQPIPARAIPRPLVGRPRNQNTTTTATATPSTKNPWKKPTPTARERFYFRAYGKDGSYNYDRTAKETVAPSGVPTRLPSVPLYKKK
jgi:hypothetical protein